MTPPDRQVQLLSDPAAIDALAGDWDALVREAPALLAGQDGTVGFAWFEALRAVFPEVASAALVVCRDAGRVHGLLPVVELRRRPLFGAELGLPTELYGGRCAPLLASPDPGMLAAQLAALYRSRPGWASLQMTVVSDSPAATLLRDTCRELNWRWTEQALAPAAYFPIPDAQAGLRTGMSANAWQNLCKARNRAARLGHRLEIREFARPEQAAELLDAVLSIERNTWKHAAGSAITNHPRQQAFYGALFSSAMRQGLLLGLVMYLDGHPIAHHFGLLRQGVFCCLKHSHVQDQDALSPSKLLLADLLERLGRRGVHVFDWMGVVEPHKLRWSQDNAFYRRSCFRLYNPSFGAAALLTLRRAIQPLRRRLAGERPPPERLCGAPAPADRAERLEVLDPGPQLAALAPQWDALVRDEPQALQGLDMTSGACWFQALAASRQQAARARVLVKRSGPQLLALLPLIRQASGLLGSRIQLATELYGGRNGLLMQHPERQGVEELLRGLRQAYPDWVTFQCTLQQGSDSLRLLLDAAAVLGLSVQQRPVPPSPYVALLDSAEAFNAGVSRSVLRNMRSSLRRAAGLGQLSYREYRAPEQADAMLAMLLEVERGSWKHRAGTAITAHPEQEAFYRALALPAMRQGLLYVLALYLDDRPISYQLGLLHGRVYSCLKNSMVEAHGELRPSYLIKAELFDRLRAMGVRTVDLMGQVEPHKLIWAPQTPSYERVLVTVYRRGMAGRTLALARRLKARFGRAAPADAHRNSDEAPTIT